MNLRLAHKEYKRVNAIVADACIPNAAGRTRARKILQFNHYCTDAPI
jgi:hypothetical protein